MSQIEQYSVEWMKQTCNHAKRESFQKVTLKKCHNYGVNLYLDGTGFAVRTNLMDQAFASQVREGKRTKERLSCECTAKGKKEGSTHANFMVDISYDRVVVTCEQYKSINGPKFSKMMDNCLFLRLLT